MTELEDLLKPLDGKDRAKLMADLTSEGWLGLKNRKVLNEVKRRVDEILETKKNESKPTIQIHQGHVFIGNIGAGSHIGGTLQISPAALEAPAAKTGESTQHPVTTGQTHSAFSDARDDEEVLISLRSSTAQKVTTSKDVDLEDIATATEEGIDLSFDSVDSVPPIPRRWWVNASPVVTFPVPPVPLFESDDSAAATKPKSLRGILLVCHDTATHRPAKVRFDESCVIRGYVEGENGDAYYTQSTTKFCEVLRPSGKHPFPPTWIHTLHNTADFEKASQCCWNVISEQSCLEMRLHEIDPVNNPPYNEQKWTFLSSSLFEAETLKAVIDIGKKASENMKSFTTHFVSCMRRDTKEHMPYQAPFLDKHRVTAFLKFASSHGVETFGDFFEKDAEMKQCRGQATELALFRAKEVAFPVKTQKELDDEIEKLTKWSIQCQEYSDTLCLEKNRLADENSGLRSKNQQLVDENSRLLSKNQQLAHENAELRSKNQHLDDAYRRLRQSPPPRHGGHGRNQWHSTRDYRPGSYGRGPSPENHGGHGRMSRSPSHERHSRSRSRLPPRPPPRGGRGGQGRGLDSRRNEGHGHSERYHRDDDGHWHGHDERYHRDDDGYGHHERYHLDDDGYGHHERHHRDDDGHGDRGRYHPHGDDHGDTKHSSHKRPRYSP